MFSHHDARTCSGVMVRENHMFSHHAARTCSRPMTREWETCSRGKLRKDVKNMFSHNISPRLLKPEKSVVFTVFNVKIFTKETASKAKYSCSEWKESIMFWCMEFAMEVGVGTSSSQDFSLQATRSQCWTWQLQESILRGYKMLLVLLIILSLSYVC